MNDRNFFVHHTALCNAREIGPGTRIWAFCNVQEDARIGADCNICDHCFVENNAVIGDRVTIKNGVSIWDGVVIEDDVFIGPNAVFTNDVYPRSKARLDDYAATRIERGATVGANASVVAGHTIGRYAFIGAGAVVTKDVAPHTLWLGNPAKQAGYVCRCARRLDIGDSSSGVSCPACNRAYRFIDNILTLIDTD